MLYRVDESYLNRTVNCDVRPTPNQLLGVIWHGTGGNPANPKQTLEWNLKPRVVDGKRLESSYTELIAVDKTVYLYVDPLTQIAWHAGASSWNLDGQALTGYRINRLFLGVEIDETNRGVPIPQCQLDACAGRALFFRDTYGIPLDERYHLAHKQIAPGRKIDPTCVTPAQILARARELDANPLLLWGNRVPYRPTWLIPTAWRARKLQLGEALALPSDMDGVTVQPFEGGVIEYTPATGAVVRLKEQV